VPIEGFRVPRGVRIFLWTILVLHIVAVVGYGGGEWVEAWYKRASWCGGFMAATALLSMDWLSRRCAPQR
jgi:hypothetical protein